MKIFIIRTHELNSLSVYPDEVKAVQLEPGEIIWCKGVHYAWGTPVALIVDRLGWKGTDIKCTAIRQILRLDSSSQVWGQQAVFDPDGVLKAQKEIAAVRRAMVYAQYRDYPVCTVRGGIIPLVKDGYVAIPSFRMSGTSWRIAPMEDLEKEIQNVTFFQFFMSDEEEQVWNKKN